MPTDLQNQTPEISNALTFNNVLSAAGLNISSVRLLRHQERSKDGRTPYDLWREDPSAFEIYQSRQAPKSRARFQHNGGRAVWASFVATDDGSTLFVGLYDATFVGPTTADYIHEFTEKLEVSGSTDQFDVQRRPEIWEFSERLFVHWGAGFRSWVQRAQQQDKAIVELKRFRHEPPFPGLLSFSLELSRVPGMPMSWKAILNEACGVYMLTCPNNGPQYVGSATGIGGFLGRWSEYARTGHGGNVGLKDIDTSKFICTILEVAGVDLSDKQAVERENVWKAKLFTRTRGLNRN
jgi:GIY-YIG catalytic domain